MDGLDADRRAMGSARAANPDMPATGQSGAAEPAPDDERDHMASS